MITRESDYAIRCILYLAGSGEGLTSVKEVAGAMDIPQSFLAKILQKLLKSGLVKSVRGAGGGFRLSRAPEEISLYDVVQAIDGTVSMNKCVDAPDSCELNADCPVHPIWVDVSHDLEEVLKKKDFKTLAAKAVRR